MKDAAAQSASVDGGICRSQSRKAASVTDGVCQKRMLLRRT
jgi:hypothetical protein